jgi:hypothetical protein
MVEVFELPKFQAKVAPEVEVFVKFTTKGAQPVILSVVKDAEGVCA